MIRRIATAAAISTLALSGLAGVASAGDWNAVAWDKTSLSAAFAAGMDSQEAAEKEARRECQDFGDPCNEVQSHEGGCLAFARNEDSSSLGMAMKDTIQDTVVAALDQCMAHAPLKDCSVHANTCANYQ